jgi:hypothetical protein
MVLEDARVSSYKVEQERNGYADARTLLKDKLKGNWVSQVFLESPGHINLCFAGMHVVNISKMLGATRED